MRLLLLLLSTACTSTTRVSTTPERWSGPEPLIGVSLLGQAVQIPREHARRLCSKTLTDRVLLDVPDADRSLVAGTLLVVAGGLFIGLGATIAHDCPQGCNELVQGAGAAVALPGAVGALAGLGSIIGGLTGPASPTALERRPADLDALADRYPTGLTDLLTGQGTDLTMECDDE